MTTTIANCPRCDEESRLRAREFSDQATSALISWGEIIPTDIGLPVCDECYTDLREVLIDRVEELGQPIDEPQSKSTTKPRKKSGRKAS